MGGLGKRLRVVGPARLPFSEPEPCPWPVPGQGEGLQIALYRIMEMSYLCSQS